MKSTVYTHGGAGTKVRVTGAAEELIGPTKIPGFVRGLTEIMEAIDAPLAYVKKRWETLVVDIYVRRPKDEAEDP